MLISLVTEETEGILKSFEHPYLPWVFTEGGPTPAVFPALTVGSRRASQLLGLQPCCPVPTGR